MARPRISDDLVQQITDHADGLLESSPVDAADLPFERRLEVVFEAARGETGPGGTDSVPDGTGEEHPGGDAAAEALLVDGL